jgi:hypothetical protein
MLEIQAVEALDSKSLNVTRRKSTKKQILLHDTFRRGDDFLNKLKHRRNGAYDRVPHFFVSKTGVVYQIFDTNHYSSVFADKEIDKRFIVVAIENLGWLLKNTITGFLNNWVGDPYRAEPYTKSWRNYFYWDRYGDDQLKSVGALCEHLCDKHSIAKQIVPSQGYIENALNFNGVVCKSNFSNIYTDINPSFKFDLIFKNEQ